MRIAIATVGCSQFRHKQLIAMHHWLHALVVHPDPFWSTNIGPGGQERGVRHFLEGRTRFRNHSDFSEINDFISDFMISIVIS